MSSTSSMIVFALFCMFALSAASSLRAKEEQSQRNLQQDALFPTDLCKNGPGEDDIGACDLSRFPICEPGELRCYNRKVWRNRFFTDIQQPMYYIDYDMVLCYPQGELGACSSCSPGRYCVTEDRCILDELRYECDQWM